MADAGQLPHILKLVDDECDGVRRAVARALAEFGPSLQRELANLDDPPDSARLDMIEALLQEFAQDASKQDEAAKDEAEDAVANRAVANKAVANKAVAEEVDGGEPLFRPGQVVRHKRYKYRGVVVSCDATCKADDNWYFANRTQPDREQPWYHVLVDGSHHVTYAAQVNLERDTSGERIEHPFVERFFSAFDEGQYVRNDTPWPES